MYVSSMTIKAVAEDNLVDGECAIHAVAGVVHLGICLTMYYHYVIICMQVCMHVREHV